VSKSIPILILAALCGAFTLRSAQEPSSAPRLRIGTYDNRAIAVAYANSRFNPVGEKMAEFEAAKAAGDTERVAALEAWGEKLQRALHRQGFARVPVDDLLSCVAERLPAVAEESGVDAIVFACDWSGPEVERVDVTRALVQLFDPSEQGLRWIDELLEQAPLDLDEIDQDHDH